MFTYLVFKKSVPISQKKHCLHYEDKSFNVVWRSNRCLTENHGKSINTLTAEILMLKQIAYVVTAILQKLKWNDQMIRTLLTI